MNIAVDVVMDQFSRWEAVEEIIRGLVIGSASSFFVGDQVDIPFLEVVLEEVRATSSMMFMGEVSVDDVGLTIG